MSNPIHAGLAYGSGIGLEKRAFVHFSMHSVTISMHSMHSALTHGLYVVEKWILECSEDKKEGGRVTHYRCIRT